MRDFLRDNILRILEKDLSVGNDTDFFSLGMDSLQAIQVRSEVLRNVYLGDKKLGMNLVFDYPAIDRLSTHLYQLPVGEEIEAASVGDEMKALVEKYSSFTGVPMRSRYSLVSTARNPPDFGACLPGS